MVQTAEAGGRWLWGLALAGLFLFVLAAVVLSAPGRVDTIDAQNRYFVAQSLYERGDAAITEHQQYDVFEDRFDFLVVEGRDGFKFSTYRLPHSALGALAIAVADRTEVAYETRRHYFFSLINSVTAALLAVAYALWFRQQGLSRLASVGWALAGLFCTPSWFFGTSSYDDLLGVPAVVFGLWAAAWGWRGPGLLETPAPAAPRERGGWGGWLRATARAPLTAYRGVRTALRERREAVASGGRNRLAYLGAAVAGLAFGYAFNAKEPLAVWILPAYALVAVGLPRWRSKLLVGLVLTGAFAVGFAVHTAYELVKFPIKMEQPLEQTIGEMKERERRARTARRDQAEVRAELARAAAVVAGPPSGPLTTAAAAGAAAALAREEEEVPEPNPFLVFVELFKHQDFVEHQLQGYMRAFPGTPLIGTICLLVSPATGIVWFCPPVILGVGGLVLAFRGRWGFALLMALACVVFFGFTASLRFFKGDLSWGPRYLTPLYAVLWLLAPRVRHWPAWLVVQLLVLGALIQVMALSVPAQRVYIKHRWFPEVGTQWEDWFNLSPLPSQLLHRPIEMGEVLHEDGSKVEKFSINRYPTGSAPINHLPHTGPEVVRKYHYLGCWRPWWVSLWYVDEDERPVDIAKTVVLLEGVMAAGLFCMIPVWLARRRRAGAAAEAGGLEKGAA